MEKQARRNIAISLIPLIVLVGLLSLDISIFGSDAILGASQVSLLVASGVCIALAMWLFKTPWKAFEEAISANVASSINAFFFITIAFGNRFYISPSSKVSFIIMLSLI